ncbi:wax synthase family protein [Herpetosiphon llansteffanensis]
MRVVWLISLLTSTGLALLSLPQYLRDAQQRRWAAWFLAFLAIGNGLWLSQPWPLWGRIIAIWVPTYLAFKGWRLLYSPHAQTKQLGFWRNVGFIFWLGMQLEPWLLPRQPDLAWRKNVAHGALWLGFGGVIGLVAWFWPTPTVGLWLLWRCWLALVGVVISLFFGVTRLYLAIWQAFGWQVQPLFLAPIYSRSVSEWWGKRWNMAVHEVLSVVVWQPLKPLIGSRWAAAMVFIVSGLLHELLLSYPAAGGWGWPTGYFVVQIAATSLERQRSVRAWLRRSSYRQIIWTLSWTIIPAPLLFRPELVLGLFAAYLP